MLTFKTSKSLGPTNLQDCIVQYISTGALCSSDNNLLVAPGPRYIRLFQPWFWPGGTLPNSIRALWDLMQFCRACKVEIFHQGFGWGQWWLPSYMAPSTISHSSLPFLCPLGGGTSSQNEPPWTILGYIYIHQIHDVLSYTDVLFPG